MKATKRSPCPVACTLDMIGDKWTLLLIRDLGCGKSQFGELRDSPEGIATNILADRLNKLVDEGLVERYPSPHQAGRELYRLTRKGKSLGPVLQAVADWGLQHIPGTKKVLQPSL